MKAEEFIKDYTMGCSNELCAVEDRFGKKVISYHEWLTPDQARGAVEIEREEVIEKACEWLKDNASNYIIEHPFSSDVDFEEDKMIDDFKKYMKEE